MILSILKNKNYVVYHTRNQDYKVRSDMNTEFINISKYGFIRPHIGYAVNNKSVQYIVADCVLLQNDINIPLTKNTERMLEKSILNGWGDMNV